MKTLDWMRKVPHRERWIAVAADYWYYQ